MKVVRGSVHWYVADPVLGSEQAGRRPALVVSRNSINRSSPVVIIVPLTTYRGQTLYPSDTLLEPPEAGIRQASVAIGLQIRAVDRRRLDGELGQLSRSAMTRIEAALLQVLDIDVGGF